MKWFIGCSGFHYTHWKPGFYPKDLPQRLWFEYYNERFNTLELNTTFYNFPKAPFLKDWYKRSPSNFKFAVKASRIITHYKKFVEVKSLMEDFYDVIDKNLKDKLGCILFQLPPNLHFSEAKLLQIIASLNLDYSNVLEFRHKSWWNNDVYEALRKKNITFCSISHPELPKDLIFNTTVAYCRMHGTEKLYSSNYKTSTLQKLYDEILESKKTRQAFIYFNNDINVAAVRNAIQLKIIGGEKIREPQLRINL